MFFQNKQYKALEMDWEEHGTGHILSYTLGKAPCSVQLLQLEGQGVHMLGVFAAGVGAVLMFMGGRVCRADVGYCPGVLRA